MVLVRIAVIVIKCRDQNNLGRKGLSSSYTLTSPFTNSGSQDKNLEEAGTEAEAMGDCFLHVCPHGLLPRIDSRTRTPGV